MKLYNIVCEDEDVKKALEVLPDSTIGEFVAGNARYSKDLSEVVVFMNEAFDSMKFPKLSTKNRFYRKNSPEGKYNEFRFTYLDTNYIFLDRTEISKAK